MIRPNPSRTHTWRHAGPRAAVHAALREDRRSPARERTRRPGLTSLIRFLVVASVFALGDATCRSGSSTASGLEGKPARSVGGVVRRLQRGREHPHLGKASSFSYSRRSRSRERFSACSSRPTGSSRVSSGTFHSGWSGSRAWAVWIIDALTTRDGTDARPRWDLADRAVLDAVILPRGRKAPMEMRTPTVQPTAGPSTLHGAARRVECPRQRRRRVSRMEAVWKRQTAVDRSSSPRPIGRRAGWATGGSRPQQVLAPSKQRVAGSSPAGGILRRPLPKRNVCHGSSGQTCPE